jgi:hypothetical protein
VFYVQVTPDDAADIVRQHLVGNGRVVRLLYEEPLLKKKIEKSRDIPFYKKQIRVALRNCGVINPENILEYIAADGFQALGKCLKELTGPQVIDFMKKSGLRGRGGGAFPTGLKWEAAGRFDSKEKFIICNADEGEPGTFKDRELWIVRSSRVIPAAVLKRWLLPDMRSVHQWDTFIFALNIRLQFTDSRLRLSRHDRLECLAKT